MQVTSSSAQVAVELVGNGERLNLIQSGAHPRYAPSGHLMYVQGGSLMAVAFDPQRLEGGGTSIPNGGWCHAIPDEHSRQYSFSDNGSTRLRFRGHPVGPKQASLGKSNGAEQPVAAPVTHIWAPGCIRMGGE